MSSGFFKDTRFNAHFIYEDIDQPYILVNAAGTPAYYPAPIDAPFKPGSIQYFELYASRILDLSNQPNSVMDFRGSVSHRMSKEFSLNGSFTWKKSENDTLDYSTWTKDRIAFNASAWFAPTEELFGTVSYNYIDEKTETMYVLPIFDG
jgi:hypothetical protein